MIRIFLPLTILLYALGVSSQGLSFEEMQKREVIIEGRENSSWAMKQDYVIMISVDGFRFDYAEKFNAENLLKLKSEGVSLEKLLPSFPTKTFPNHYTLVTGLYPGNHGLVSNEFYCRSKKSWYRIRDKDVVRDGSWYGGIPLWALAEQQEMLSASFFWVGSEAKIGGFLPTYTYAYDRSVPNAHRITQLLDWLGLPEKRRPHLLLGYFSIVDDAGHRYGPDHPMTGEAVLEIDSLIGVLLKGVSKTGLPVHTVLVSDHGMSSISHGEVLPELVDLGDSKVAYSFPPMIYQDDSAEVERIYRSLLAVPTIDVYKGNRVPEYLNFKNKDCVGDLVLMTRPPTIILHKPKQVYGGTHGFDPFLDPNMGALFIATGPRLKKNLELPPVENIHVYPFIARLLGLEILSEIDGKGDFLAPAFK